MRRLLTFIASGLAFLFFILLLTSCSGGSKATDQSGDLTKEKQFEDLNEFINFDLQSDESLVDVNAIFAGQSSSPYWDGVDSADVISSGLLASPQVSGLGKISALQDESLSLVYNPQSGWWAIDYVGQDDLFGIMVNVHDSVRFETLGGTPQHDPDASTYRFVERGAASLSWQLSGQNGAFNLSMNTDLNLDASGLNTNLVTVDGASSGNFDVYAANADSVIDLSLSFSGVNHNVTVDGPLPTDGACPNGGSASATLAVDLAVQEGDQSGQASGQWDVDVVFLGDGRGTVSVQSGDFTHEVTGDICH